MLKFHAHDTVNDIALIETSFSFVVRYGLQKRDFSDIESALEDFGNCQKHALAAELTRTVRA